MGSREVRAGKAFVELGLKDKLQRGLNAARKRLKSFAVVASTIGASILSVGASMLSPFSLAIGAASDLEETMNKFNVVFGENAKAVKEWGDSFAGAVGRSKKQIAEFMAGSQDLLVPMGIDPSSATEISKTLTGLAVDLASFNNMQDSDTLRDLHAALTGSGEVMKKYGVIVSQAAVNQQLLNKGLDPKEATEAQKAMARLQLIMDGTTSAQGDAIRSAGSYANQMKKLKAGFSDAMAALGTAVLPTVTKFVSIAAVAVSAVTKWTEENPGLVRTFAAVGATLVGVGGAIAAVGGVAAVASFVFGGLATAVGWVAGAVSVVGGIFAAIVSPIGLVIGAVVAAAGAFLYFSGAGSKIWDVIRSSLGACPRFHQAGVCWHRGRNRGR